MTAARSRKYVHGMQSVTNEATNINESNRILQTRSDFIPLHQLYSHSYFERHVLYITLYIHLETDLSS